MTELPLDTMTVEEKLHAMELLWADLCIRAQSLTSPDWHGHVLGERESALHRDEDAFEDWEAAKSRIAREIQ